MVLPKYFLLTARKILILPKSSKLGGAIAPPAPPAGTAMGTVELQCIKNAVGLDDKHIFLVVDANTLSGTQNRPIFFFLFLKKLTYGSYFVLKVQRPRTIDVVRVITYIV